MAKLSSPSEQAPPARPSEPSRFMEEARSLIEEALERFLPGDASESDADCPPRLAAAMRHSVLGGGKRLRPVLTLMAADACGGSLENALPAACAVEMVHAYSLVHDDLPCMDDDDLRRGRPTCHKAFDEATAVLAGDALLTLAFEVIVRHTRPADAAAECVALLAAAAGPRGMVGGQMADLESEDRPLSQGSAEALEAIHRRKTGALLRCALRLGAVVAAAPPEIARALDRYGACVGLAFQIVDDLLDVEGDESKTGKRVGKDSAAGKWTYPGFLGADESRARARRLVEEAARALEPLGDRGSRLEALAWQLLERDR